jgi:hypothetical protein
MHTGVSFRAIYFGAYDTAKSLFDKPNIGTKFAIAQVPGRELNNF